MKKQTPKNLSVPMRMGPELKAKLDRAAALAGMKQSELMRVALEVGLLDLEEIGYRIDLAISESAAAAAAHRLRMAQAAGTERPPGAAPGRKDPLRMVADAEPHYRTRLKDEAEAAAIADEVSGEHPPDPRE